MPTNMAKEDIITRLNIDDPHKKIISTIHSPNETIIQEEMSGR